MNELDDLDNAEKKLKDLEATGGKDLANLTDLKNLAVSKTKKKRKRKKKPLKKKPKKKPLEMVSGIVGDGEDEWEQATKAAKMEIF